MTQMREALARHAMVRPDAIAIDSGGETLSWAQLQAAVDHQVVLMRRRFSGVAPVAMAFDHGVAGCVTDIALLEAGIPALPLPGFFTADQKNHALRQSGAVALLSQETIIPLDSPHVGLLHPGTAKISFTSGSTGTPKGICLSASHMLGVAQAVIDTVGDAHAGRHLALLPPAILLENVAGFYATLLAGGTYVAVPQARLGLANPFAPDCALMARAIAAQAITSLILVPDYLHGLVAVMEATGLRLPRLTLVAVGGARIAPALLDRAAALGLPVRQGYGLTECASVVTLERPGGPVRGSVGASIGYNHLRLAADGEILIDGPTCLGRIGEAPMVGPLRTGDVGRIDADNRLWIEGRKSNRIITAHSRNIAPEWVESQLLAQPAIVQAMVHGEGETALGALIVPRSATSDIADAVAAANALLPVYARVAAWRVVAPFTALNGHLTGNGRLRRAAIAQAHLSGTPAYVFL